MGLHAAVVLCAVWHTRAHLSRRPSDGASTYITSVSTKRSVSPPPPLPPPESAQITGMQNVRRREDNMGEKRAGRGTKKRKRPLAYTDSHTAQGDRHTDTPTQGTRRDKQGRTGATHRTLHTTRRAIGGQKLRCRLTEESSVCSPTHGERTHATPRTRT